MHHHHRAEQPRTVLDGGCASRVSLISIVGTKLYRQGLDSVLSTRSEVSLLGSLDRVSGAIAQCIKHQPDVVLLDVEIEGHLAFMHALQDALPRTSVVALSVPNCTDAILALAEAGIAGFVTQEGTIDDLVTAVAAAKVGEFPCDARVAAALAKRVAGLSKQLVPSSAPTRLTERETEITNLIDRGLSNKQIASRLCISLSTVKNHVHSILEKLDVRTRAQAAALARQTGLLYE